ncbi:MAG: PAS domain S-box protein [Mariprofundaceae bacterium]|nr:PAS domain S-box protein [Mariprofundaceae bacterium]
MLLKYQKHLVLLILLIASLDMLAWWGSHDVLLAWVPWFKGMTFNTALGFVCLSLAILLFQCNTRFSKYIAWLLLLVLGMFACFSLVQDVFQVNLGLDQWWLPLSHENNHIYAGRMSPLTAMAFMVSCMMLMILIQWQHFKYASIISHTLILSLILLVLQGITLQFFHVNADHTWSHLASMSPMTSFSFLLTMLVGLALFQQCNPKTSLLLYSGLHLMYRLSYPQKFTLISLVMLIPLFVFMGMKWQALNASIEHGEMELRGIQHIEQTSELVLAISEHRGMSHAHFSNATLFQQELIEKNIQIDEILARNNIMDKLNQGYISIPKYWHHVLEMWHVIKGKNLYAEQSWLLHTKMTEILNDHLRSIGRESLLSYDRVPLLHDLVSFQLMILPELVEDLGQMRGQGARMLAYPVIQQEDLLKVENLKHQARFLLHESEEILSYVWHHKQVPQLNIAYQIFRQKTEAFLDHHIQSPLSTRQGNSKAYFQQGTSAIQSVTDFNQVSMAYVQQQLSQRTADSLTVKYLVGLTALWVMLVILYLFFSFYQSVMLTIQLLRDAAIRMRNGESNILSKSPTHDELGQVVESFNSIGYELLQMSTRMHAVVECAVDGIVTIRSSGEIYHINPAAEKIFAYQHGEVLGRNITMLMPENFRKKHQDGLKRYLETGEQRLLGCSFEVEGLRKTKESFPLTISINEMHVGAERMFVAMMRDISDFKKMEQQFIQAEKMEAMGELVGGVAHHFNNMLAAITGKAYLAKHRIANKPKWAYQQLESIEMIVEQAASMIQQLLVFSKKDFLKKKVNVSLNKVIHEAYSTSRVGLPEDIHMFLDLPNDDVVVYADREQLGQVVLHLLNNASDAVAERVEKNIHLSLSLADLDADFYQRHDALLKEGKYACLTVEDTGHGMDGSVQARIFDPFYSTKEVGKGTGLGLSSVLGSVQSHGGVIEVVSTPNVGTYFYIYLPVVQLATSRLKPSPMSQSTSMSQQGMLLVVDDEPLVVESRQEVLEAFGYQVVTAKDGQQGLKVFEQYRDEIVAVVTDVVMPNMDGVQMMHTIRQCAPTLPAVFITGYDLSCVKLSNETREYSRVLSKPVKIAVLSEIIQTLLEA